jgi:hypothetical protein
MVAQEARRFAELLGKPEAPAAQGIQAESE